MAQTKDRKEYQKQWHLDNKDRLAKKAKQYRLNNKKKIAEKAKQYYLDNKDKIEKQKKQHQLDNKEKIVEQRKQWYLNNKDKILEQKKQYYLDNKKKIAEKAKQYYLINKDIIAEQKNQYRLANKDKIAKQVKQWLLDNKDKIREYKNQYKKNRRKTDPNYKLREITGCAIWKGLKRNAGSKQGESCLKHLPYTITELKQHLEKQFEPWMNWDNHGKLDSNNRTWQIDHKEAQSKFNIKKMGDSEFIKCWALSNLQPLEAFANLKKSNKTLSEE